MQIYSPYPEEKSELDDGGEDLVRRLIHESGVDRTFVGQHVIDRMLRGVWDGVSKVYSRGRHE